MKVESTRYEVRSTTEVLCTFVREFELYISPVSIKLSVASCQMPVNSPCLEG